MFKKFLKIVALLFFVLGISGCIGTNEIEPSKENVTKVIFYRTSDNLSTPITIAVQDSIVGILKSNQYLEANVCGGTFPVRTTTRIGDKIYPKSTILTIQEGQSAYVLIDTTDSIAQPIVIEEPDKKSIVRGKSSVINRYAPDCTR